MTDRMIDNRVKKLLALESEIAELEKAADMVRDELKAELESMGVNELRTSSGRVIRWKEIVTNRFDSKAFKSAYNVLYAEFLKKSVSRRFTVA